MRKLTLFLFVLLSSLPLFAQGNQNNFGNLQGTTSVSALAAAPSPCLAYQLFVVTSSGLLEFCNPAGTASPLLGLTNSVPALMPSMLDLGLVFVGPNSQYTSLAAAAWSPNCYNTSIKGCIIFDDYPETFYAQPLPASANDSVYFSRGTNPTNSANGAAGKWSTLVPITLAADQFNGQAVQPGSSANGVLSTGLQACLGDSNTPNGCNGRYFPSRAPTLTATPTGTTSTSGGFLLDNVNYTIRWVPVVNLLTSCDSQSTATWTTLPTSTAVFAGQCFRESVSASCSGSACTEVVVTAGTTGGSISAYSASFGGQTTQGTAVLQNIGRFTAASTIYGTPAYGLPGPASANLNPGGAGGTSGSIQFVAPSVPAAFPTCTNTTSYTTGQYVQDSGGTNLFRVIGSGTASVCASLTTTPGAVTCDTGTGSCGVAGTATLYFQFVGSTSAWSQNAASGYMPVAGYVPYISKAGTNSTPTSQMAPGVNYGAIGGGTGIGGTCAPSSGCFQVGNQMVVTPGTTFTFTGYINSPSRPVPTIDMENSLVTFGQKQNNDAESNPDSPDTIIDGFYLDCNSAAGIGVLNLMGQEISRLGHSGVRNCDEAPVSWITPGSPNSRIDDVNITTSYFPVLSRMSGGIYAWGNSITNAKQISQVTVTPQGNNPGSTTIPNCILLDGNSNINFALFTGIHCEGTTDGIVAQAGHTEIVHADFGTTTNGLHIKSNLSSIAAIGIGGGATNAIQDDITSTTVVNPIAPSGNWYDYFLGPADANSNRVRITTAPNITQLFNSPFSILPAGRSSGTTPYFQITEPADTGITAATESNGLLLATGTRTWATTGTVTTQREVWFQGPTYASASASQTFTDVYTVAVTPPIAGTNAIFTRGHSLGVIDSTSASGSAQGGFTVCATPGTVGTCTGIGGGNINTGNNATAAGQIIAGTAAGSPGLRDLTIGMTTSAMGAQSSASCTNITNMTWNIAANKNYFMRCSIPVTFAASATLQFCIGGPGTPTSHTIHAYDALGAAGVFGDVNLVNSATYGTKTTATGAVNGTQVIEVSATIRNGATASGTALTLQTAANGTNNITVLADATCELHQAN